MPSAGQIGLVLLAIGLFLIGGGISLSRLWVERPWSRLSAKICLYLGLTSALASLIWHSNARQNWWPLEDNFDALIWLALGLTVFVLYVQRRRPLAGLDWFIMPIVVLLLAAAAIAGSTNPRSYDVRGIWSWVHLAGAYGGAALFAVAGAAGSMYLVTNYRLRHKVALDGPNLGSLERLEHLTLTAVTLGFALLTAGAVTGFAKMKTEQHAVPVAKIVLSSVVWLIFAIVLHSPINPRFRGRRAALLSIVGCLLMLGTVIAVLFMPATA